MRQRKAEEAAAKTPAPSSEPTAMEGVKSTKESPVSNGKAKKGNKKASKKVKQSPSATKEGSASKKRKASK